MNNYARLTSIGAAQKGFSLVELMIAGTLGLLLTAGALQLFLGSNRNFDLQSGLADIQEDGRFALMFIENEVQKGAWFDDFNRDRPAAINFTLSKDGDADSSDTFAVSYQAAIDGVANRDCNGEVILSGLVTNTFSVGGASGEELLCQGNGGGKAQPLIDGVKNLQVLYGVETNAVCPDGAINQYMNRTQVVAAGESNLVVASLRIALLLGSEDNVMDTKESHDHYLLDVKKTTKTQLAYRVFQKTIYMPNAFFATAGNPSIGVSCLASQVGS